MCFKKCVLKTYVLEYIVFSILFYSWKYENYFGNFCIINKYIVLSWKKKAKKMKIVLYNWVPQQSFVSKNNEIL